MSIWDLAKPVIAQVHGYCLAGGSELATGCDLVYVADDAQIGYPAVRFGTPDMQYHAWLFGMRAGMESMLTGDSFSGPSRRARLGQPRLPGRRARGGRARPIASRIAQIPSDVVQINKRTVHRAMEAMGLRASIRSGTELSALATHSADRAELHQGPRRDRRRRLAHQAGHSLRRLPHRGAPRRRLTRDHCLPASSEIQVDGDGVRIAGEPGDREPVPPGGRPPGPALRVSSGEPVDGHRDHAGRLAPRRHLDPGEADEARRRIRVGQLRVDLDDVGRRRDHPVFRTVARTVTSPSAAETLDVAQQRTSCTTGRTRTGTPGRYRCGRDATSRASGRRRTGWRRVRRAGGRLRRPGR